MPENGVITPVDFFQSRKNFIYLFIYYERETIIVNVEK